MVLDLICLTLLVVFFIRGYMKGVIVAAFSLLAILLGVLCALKLSHKLAGWLFSSGLVTSAWGPLISYLILFILVVWMVRLVAKAIEKSTEAVLLGWVNKAIGGVLYAFIAAIAWSTLLYLLNMGHLLPPETLYSSKTYPWVSPLAPWIFDHIGQVWPFAKDLFSDFSSFFDQVNETLPDHVGAHR